MLALVRRTAPITPLANIFILGAVARVWAFRFGNSAERDSRNWTTYGAQLTVAVVTFLQLIGYGRNR